MGVVHNGLVEKGSERVKGGVRDGHPGMGKESVKEGVQKQARVLLASLLTWSALNPWSVFM